MRGRRRGTVTGALTLLGMALVGMLAGCGGSPDDVPASATARFTDAASMAGAAASAIEDQGSYRVWMAQSASSVTVEYFVRLREGGQDYAITVTHPQEWVTVIEVDDTYYRQQGTDSSTQPWQQVPFETIRSDPDLGALTVEVDWPAKFRALGQAEEFTPSAPTVVDGKTVTTYTLVLGPEALGQMLRTDLLTEQERQEMSSLLVGQAATVEVTLGEDNLPHTVVWSYGTAAATVSTHYAFSHWGETTVVAPDLG
jgi:hypothetical protein